MVTETRGESGTMIFEEKPFMKMDQVKPIVMATTAVVVMLTILIYLLHRAGWTGLNTWFFPAYFLMVFGTTWYHARHTHYRLRTDGIQLLGPGNPQDELVVPWERILWIGPAPTKRRDRAALDQRFNTNSSRYRRFPASLIGKNEWRIIYRREILTHGASFMPSTQFVNEMQALIDANGLLTDKETGGFAKGE